MRVLLSPQMNEDDILTYEFIGDKIIATYNGEVDEFDFTNMPDGEAGEIVTTLPIRPIIEARRVNGVLEVILLNFIGMNATREENFPEWKEV